MNYTTYRFSFSSQEEFVSDILAAMLGDIGFESFSQTDSGLDAFIPTHLKDDNQINRLISEFPFDSGITYTSHQIEDKNWNEEWEKHFFEPIIIDEQCVIRSSFHKDFPAARYDVIIDPKMAFGTGHHETTSLMVSEILKMDLSEKTVLDMGCGTSVLAILASMRHAKQITAIDIDDWCVDNSLENLTLNGIKNVDVHLGDARLLTGMLFDVIIANINRNILLNDMSTYIACLPSDGILLLSGFYTEDIPLLKKEGSKHGLQFIYSKEKNNWAMMKMRKTNVNHETAQFL